ncbi:MAG TPA: putative sugar nucleotidyl transferase, partial [Gemmatimonadales bacterium]|nr:putative sugar nucleotidyl transferase [Gemmatimonadales bacterium]
MSSLYLLEPDPAGPTWAPFAGVRPVAELRAGVWRIRERWEGALQRDTTAVLGSHVEGFTEFDEPPARAPMPIEGPAIIAASWFAPSGAPIESTAPVRRLTHGGTTVAWVVPAGEHWERPNDEGPGLEVDGVLLRGAYDLVTALERLLPADCADFRAAPSTGVPEGSIVLGDAADVICLRAAVEPGVVFDVRGGPVVLEEGAEVRSGTRLEGPSYVGI